MKLFVTTMLMGLAVSASVDKRVLQTDPISPQLQGDRPNGLANVTECAGPHESRSHACSDSNEFNCAGTSMFWYVEGSATVYVACTWDSIQPGVCSPDMDSVCKNNLGGIDWATRTETGQTGTPLSKGGEQHDNGDQVEA